MYKLRVGSPQHIKNSIIWCGEPEMAAHILIFPFPAQGHILSNLDLVHHLCLHSDLRFTVVVTPSNVPTLAPLCHSHPSRIQTLVLPFPTHPSFPPGLENIRDLGGPLTAAMSSAFKQLSPLIFQWFRSQTDPPVAIIADLLLGWVADLAQDIRVAYFSYISCGAFALSVIKYCGSHEHIREMEAFEFNELPGSPSFKGIEIPGSFLRYAECHPDSEALRYAVLANWRAHGTIINTFEALEGKHVNYIMKEHNINEAYCVGPLSVGGSKREESDSDQKFSWLFEWLDALPPESVLYVCFGSQTFLNEEQMKGVAAGLEASGSRFVWVVKSSSGNGPVPEGFEEKMREEGRGVVVKEWAPQKKILGHKAVGGFVSHCGWNSVLEGIECGVRFLTWPMEAEQFQNAWLLEVDLKVGFRVCQGGDSVPDPLLLARHWAADTDELRAARRRAAQLKREAVAAMVDGGSSFMALRRLGVRLLHLNREAHPHLPL